MHVPLSLRLCYVKLYWVYNGGVAQWFRRLSLAGGLFLIYA